MKFKFYDKAEVIGGFYTGVKGDIIDFKCETNEYLIKSLHNVTSHYFVDVEVWIHKDYLRRI